jgi:hypothetical protein
MNLAVITDKINNNGKNNKRYFFPKIILEKSVSAEVIDKNNKTMTIVIIVPSPVSFFCPSFVTRLHDRQR